MINYLQLEAALPNYQHQSRTQDGPEIESPSAGVTNVAQETLGNQQIIDIIRAQNNPTGQRDLNPQKNGIVFMGMNTYAHYESQALNCFNKGDGGVRSALPQKKQDHLKRGSTEYDLATESGAASYIATLGLPDNLAIKAATFLVNAGEDARDELGEFIRILSEAEMGERKIDRMVLSGHSAGSQIWGDDNGEILFDQLAELTKLFPNAMGQVQHLFMSACSTGKEEGIKQYPELFQGLESVFAYHASSPGTWTGAIDHLGQWEEATEAGKPASNVDPSLVDGIRKSKNSATWNKTDGYQGKAWWAEQDSDR